MNIILIPPSDKELDEAIAYYNDQFFGLGDNFYKEFIDLCRILAIYPNTWRKIGENTHRINFKRFPYLILYGLDGEDLLITCIAHHHRDPDYYFPRIY
jgi:hypothetical protein